MPNIKFNYLYRDSANYKKFNSIIFENDTGISIEDLETFIKSKLINGEWFYADQWKLPEIFPDAFDFKTDPTWQEFEDVEYTNEDPDTAGSLNEFIKLLETI